MTYDVGRNDEATLQQQLVSHGFAHLSEQRSPDHQKRSAA